MAHRKHFACDSECPVHAARTPVDNDPWNLQRFVEAQDDNDNYERAMDEVRAGNKTSHWMWFVYPIIAGLRPHPSAMTTRYALRHPNEVRAYLEHPLLGPRIGTSALALHSRSEDEIGRILGEVDCDKFHASLTLFHLCSETTEVFAEGLIPFRRWHQPTIDLVAATFPDYLTAETITFWEDRHD
jgi:uncharacterized protein (DUF1810 family)